MPLPEPIRHRCVRDRARLDDADEEGGRDVLVNDEDPRHADDKPTVV